MTGWVFSAVCALVFLLPLILAITGASLFGKTPTQGLIGGVAGFTIGWITSTIITRVAALESSQT
jgi:uncharacterized membrane protein (DUF485 family)